MSYPARDRGREEGWLLGSVVEGIGSCAWHLQSLVCWKGSRVTVEHWWQWEQRANLTHALAVGASGLVFGPGRLLAASSSAGPRHWGGAGMRRRPWLLAQALVQAATGMFHPGSWVPAWGCPGDAARAVLEELLGKIRSDACLWAWGMRLWGPSCSFRGRASPGVPSALAGCPLPWTGPSCSPHGSSAGPAPPGLRWMRSTVRTRVSEPLSSL